MIAAPVHNQAEIEPLIVSLAREPGTGLIVMPDIFILAHREQIIALADRYRMPAAYAYRLFAASGGLMSYGTDLVDLFRRAAPYVDRILKGEKPANLPVQTPTKYELVINLKAAKAYEVPGSEPLRRRRPRQRPRPPLSSSPASAIPSAQVWSQASQSLAPM
jgi:putative tryptophan/tyrosine transport system substrate-binding protein